MSRTPPRVTLDTPLGKFVDLDLEDVRLPSGARLTNELADEIVGSALRTAGRPSLTAPGKRSPSVTIRLPESLNDKLSAEAARTGKRSSDISREALATRVAG